jgi:NitT/TauT family transport system substrate-binding protein
MESMYLHNILNSHCHWLLKAFAVITLSNTLAFAEKVPIKAIYIPLADHYAGVLAYEKYRDKMIHADYSIEQMKSWGLLRALFQSGDVDMAYVISPMAMDMFRERPESRWVTMLHRDGNALAINDLLNEQVKLTAKRVDRKPDQEVAHAFSMASKKARQPIEVAVPHLQSTHTVVLYQYLKNYGKTLAIGRGTTEDAVAVAITPPKSPAFIKKKSNRHQAAAFEQSLPWADVVETNHYGHVAWYSKDVMQWPKGHVECIAIAQDTTIKNKEKALREVIRYIHKAGEDIENARRTGGKAIEQIAQMVQKHIPQHNKEAIIQSLRPDLNVINYRNLNNDEAGLKNIMDIAVEAGIIEASIDIASFSDTQFSTR